MVYKRRLDVDKMIELYNLGFEPEEIGKEYGYKNGEYITTKLRQAGVYKSKRLDKGKVMALHKAGWSNQAIAFEMITTVEEIERALNDSRRI